MRGWGHSPGRPGFLRIARRSLSRREGSGRFHTDGACGTSGKKGPWPCRIHEVASSMRFPFHPADGDLQGVSPAMSFPSESLPLPIRPDFCPSSCAGHPLLFFFACRRLFCAACPKSLGPEASFGACALCAGCPGRQECRQRRIWCLSRVEDAWDPRRQQDAVPAAEFLPAVLPNAAGKAFGRLLQSLFSRSPGRFST